MSEPRTRPELLYAGAFLGLLALVALAWSMPWLGLVGDDWWYFAHLSDGNFLAVQLYENPARPLVAWLWPALWAMFGWHIWAYYALNGSILWLSAFLVLVTLRKLYRWRLLEATAAAALFFLYPADATRVYLSTLYAHLSVLLALGGGALWLAAWKREKPPPLLLIVSLLLMLLSLLACEIPLFPLALLPLFMQGLVRRERVAWLRRSLACYAVLLTYGAFRLGVAWEVSQRPAFYASFRLAPAWLAAQLRAFPTTVFVDGWLYALRTLYRAPAAALLAGLVVVLVVGLEWLRRRDAAQPTGTREGLGRIAAGLALAAAAVLPVVVSSFSLENIVGTLDSRLVQGAGLGHAVAVTALCFLPAVLLPLPERMRAALPVVLAAFLIALALMGTWSAQSEYMRAWRVQMDLVRSLQEQAAAFEDDTAILLLDVPAGPFDIRFYYPFTQLVQRFYANPTLHVLPWQEGFSPCQQLLAFGEENVAAVVEIVQGEVMTFPYKRMVAFRWGADGTLQPVEQIDSRYFCGEGELAFQPPEGWAPARGPVSPCDVARLRAGETPPDTPWRRWLQAQIEHLPGVLESWW